MILQCNPSNQDHRHVIDQVTNLPTKLPSTFVTNMIYKKYKYWQLSQYLRYSFNLWYISIKHIPHKLPLCFCVVLSCYWFSLFFYVLPCRYICYYNNASHPVIYDGLHLTRIWKPFIRPYYLTKRGFGSHNTSIVPQLLLSSTNEGRRICSHENECSGIE